MVELTITSDCTLHTSHKLEHDVQNVLYSILHPCEGEDNDSTKRIEFILKNKLNDNGFEISSIEWFINKEDINYRIKQDGKYTYYLVNILDFDKIDYDDIPIDIYYWKEDKVRISKIKNNEKISEEADMEDLLNDIIQATTNFGVITFERHDIFSLCKLNNCIFRLQKKLLIDKIGNCSKGFCHNNDSEPEQLKLLFITLYILEQLISLERYEEAQYILDSVSSSCGIICSNENANELLFSSCGCNN